MTDTPLVSVCMVTYNHEKYVGDAVRSVLGQSFANLELVIVNDGSTDATGREVEAFHDPRIAVIHQENQGPPAAANRAIAASRGKYVALFSGDDVCHPERIHRQLEEYGRGGRARVLFSKCDFIDDDGRPLAGDHFAERHFRFENLARPQILARFLHEGNYLNSITPFTERAIFLETPYDRCLLQLQDFDLWVRLVKKYELFIMPDALLHYRIRANQGNLSSPNRGRLLRNNNEFYLVLRRFFEGTPVELFREAFRDQLLKSDFAEGPEYACEQAFALERSQLPFARIVAIERLHALMTDPVAAEVLARQYDFDTRKFFQLLGTMDIMEPAGGNFSTLFYDSGAGWNAAESMRRPVCPASERLDLAFRLPAGTQPRALRWDPVELLTCRVRIEGIELLDSAGHVRTVDPGLVESNGSPLEDGTVSFQTADPMFTWRVDADVVGVTIRGRLETDDTLRTAVVQSNHAHDLNRVMTATKAALAETSAALAAAHEQLRATYRTRSWRVTAPLRAAAKVARRLRAA